MDVQRFYPGPTQFFNVACTLKTLKNWVGPGYVSTFPAWDPESDFVCQYQTRNREWVDEQFSHECQLETYIKLNKFWSLKCTHSNHVATCAEILCMWLVYA